MKRDLSPCKVCGGVPRDELHIVTCTSCASHTRRYANSLEAALDWENGAVFVPFPFSNADVIVKRDTGRKWLDRFMAMADLVATFSKDPSTRVGAVIVDSKNRVVSLGFNGLPRGIQDDRLDDREMKIRCTIHAEMNALHFAGRPVAYCTIYVTHPPCAQCAAHLIQNEIKTVIYRSPTPDYLSRWQADYDEAKRMFLAARVNIVEV